jgi:hypothetical protein
MQEPEGVLVAIGKSSSRVWQPDEPALSRSLAARGRGWRVVATNLGPGPGLLRRLADLDGPEAAAERLDRDARGDDPLDRDDGHGGLLRGWGALRRANMW